MQIIDPSTAEVVSGGCSVDFIADPEPLGRGPAPIWRPVFTTDP